LKFKVKTAFTPNSIQPQGLNRTIMENTTNIPRHIALIMDGNGRWAEQRGLPRMEGHRAGVKNIRPILKHLIKRGISYVTLYAFSTENWNRPEEEVDGIFHILETSMAKEARELHKNGVKIVHIGRMEGLSVKLQKSLVQIQKLTVENTKITLLLAFNYGGRAEIIDAVRKFITSGSPVDSLDEKTFVKYLYTADIPDVDLVIRTGGEIRTSNFLIWQAAYSEYYFTKVFWPDFEETELENALQAYSQRRRRFGGL
jgi:undecaprenyl diphosphate synthase